MNYSDPVVSGEAFFVARLLPLFIKEEAPTFFDVGANRGEYARLLIENFPGAKVYAFEPHPASYEALAKRRLHNVHPMQMALGAAVGSTRLYDYADSDGSTHASVYPAVFSEIRRHQAVSHVVKSKTLDAVVKSLQVARIDLLKVDAEGAELSILRGGQSLIEDGRIGMIVFEFNEMNIVSGTTLRDFREALDGYALYRLLPGGLLPIPKIPMLSEIYGYQNIVAVPSSAAAQLAEAASNSW